MSTHGASFECDAALAARWEEQQAAPRGLRALKVRIVDELFTLVGEAPWASESAADDFAAARAALLREGEACYVVFRPEAGGGWTLMSFVPDSANVREKMLYSSGRNALRAALNAGGNRIAAEVHWAGLDEAELEAAPPGEAERVAAERGLMTATEKLYVDGTKLEAIEAASGKVGGSNMAFPPTAEARAGLEAFRAGTAGVLVLAIEGETVGCLASQPAADAAALGGLLPAASPCYVVYRWAHERDGAPASAVLFLFVCPEESPVRAKMLSASSKGAVLASVQAAGVEVAKSIEGLEPKELCEAALVDEVYARDAATAAPAPALTKAAPRGGRKLVSRKKPAEAAAE